MLHTREIMTIMWRIRAMQSTAITMATARTCWRNVTSHTTCYPV